MKRLVYISLVLALFLNCEDVIDVDLNTAEPKLVIEASINYFKNTPGNTQSIKLSLTAPFFEDTIPPANGAIVEISDTNGNTFNFVETENTGIYHTNSFIPVIDEEYTLIINYNAAIYTAT